MSDATVLIAEQVIIHASDPPALDLKVVGISIDCWRVGGCLSVIGTEGSEAGQNHPEVRFPLRSRLAQSDLDAHSSLRALWNPR
jgi:hypothetical protein